jgi:hypothetical protein
LPPLDPAPFRSKKTAVAAFLVVASLLFVLHGLGAEARTLWTLPAVTLVLLGLRWHTRSGAWGRAYLALLVGTAIPFCLPLAKWIGLNRSAVPQWDYWGFWLHARTAVLGLDFYDPTNTLSVAASSHPSPPFTPEFTSEIIKAGFWYPPPSMFLFWPLGRLDPTAAIVPWYLFQCVAAALAVTLLWRIFVPGEGVIGWIACATLVCACYGTETTTSYAQTNFVALLAVLLFWRRRDTIAGGVWTSVAFFVKPFLLGLTLLPLIGRKWRTIAGALASAAALMLASALAFGRHTFFSYFARDPIHAKPDWIYHQVTNQSLLGLVSRMTHATCSGMACVTNPIFLGCAALLGATTLWLGARLQRAGEEEWALSLYLLLALIVYPVSQMFYSVFLIPPALLIWREHERVRGGPWSASIAIATVYALASLRDGEATVFAYLLMWIVTAWIGVTLPRSEDRAPRFGAGAKRTLAGESA